MLRFYVLAFFMMGHLKQAFLGRLYPTAVPGHFYILIFVSSDTARA